MKIFLLNTAKGWGGLESHSIVLGKALLELGHEVLLGCRLGGNVEKAAAENGIPTTVIRMRNALDLYSVMNLVKVLKEQQMDILVANLGKEYWPATVAARIAGVKIVLIRHQLNAVKSFTKWLIANHVDGIVGVTQAVRTVMIQSGVPEVKIAVVHPGQNMDRFRSSAQYREAVRNELGCAADDILITTAGKLHPGKGIYELLEAVEIVSAKYGKIKVMYIGDGDERIGLQNKAVNLGMGDRVILTGYRADIDRLYNAMDIFVLPSTGNESFGMVLIEAMAAGKPVIGSNRGGIPEIIRHNENGLLVQPGNVGELAEAITSLIEQPMLRRKLITNGTKTIEDNFTDLASAKKLVEVLEGLMK